MRRALAILVVGILALSAQGPARANSITETCEALPGVEQFAVDTHLRFLIVGEMHGTNETPQLIGDLACNLSSSRSVTVGLEFNAADTSTLSRYLQSNGGDDARRALLRMSVWSQPFADGRGSQAMFALIERLRRFRSAGGKVQIASFQPDDVGSMDQHYYELAMARNWARIADNAPDDLILLLVGNVHVTKSLPESYPFAPAASHLRASETITLRPEPEGGSAWNCQSDGCGPHALQGGVTKPRGVGRFASSYNGYDGSYAVGSRYSAAKPLVP